MIFEIVFLVLLIICLLVVWLWFEKQKNKIYISKAPFKTFKGAYRLCLGPRCKSWAVHKKVRKICGSEARVFAVYYDNSAPLDSDRVRWLAGCVIEEEDTNGKTQKFLSDVTVEKLVKSGYTIHTFDGNNNNLVMKLDNFSIVALFVKHFPALQAFAEREGLSSDAVIEYHRDQLYLLRPLENPERYVVNEVKKLGKDMEILIRNEYSLKHS